MARSGRPNLVVIQPHQRGGSPSRESGPAQNGSRRSRLLRFAGAIAALIYLAGTAAYLLTHGAWPTPDYLIPPLLLFAIIAGRGWAFVVDWAVFLFLLIAYQTFAGLADDLAFRVHFVELIEAERWLMGGREVPTVLLQDRFFQPERLRWYDWTATALHAVHFVAPVGFGFILWVRSRRTYWRYVLTLMAMFCAGFVTYHLYPAAPPWLAAERGLLPPVTRVLFPTLSQFPTTAPLALLYQYFSPNDVAAMPSLHGAVPALLALVSLGIWGWRALPALLYPLAGGIAFIYLGEHYAIDILAGWLYALAAFALVWIGVYAAGRRLSRMVHFPLPRPITAFPGLPQWPLAFGAVAFIVAVWFNPMLTVPLRPDQPVQNILAVPPKLEAAAAADLDPRPCPDETSASTALDGPLAALAGEYGAYLMGLGDGACFSITNVALIPPLSEEEVRLIPRSRADQMPVRVFLPEEALGHLTIARTGFLTDEAAWTLGTAPGARYAVIVRFNTTERRAEVEQLVSQIAKIVFEGDPS